VQTDWQGGLEAFGPVSSRTFSFSGPGPGLGFLVMRPIHSLIPLSSLGKSPIPILSKCEVIAYSYELS